MQEISARQNAIGQNLSARNDQKTGIEKEISETAGLLAELETRLESLRNTVRGYEMRVASRKQKAEEQKKENDRLHLDIQEQLRKAKALEDLERNLEGFAQSVKAVMREARPEGIFPESMAPFPVCSGYRSSMRLPSKQRWALPCRTLWWEQNRMQKPPFAC